jgi:hypothetical protein
VHSELSAERRQEYVLDKDVTDRGEASRACVAVLQTLRPHVRLVVVDAYTDYADELTAEARQAEAWLRRRGEHQGRRPWRRRTWPADPGMGIEVDPADDQHWYALSAYAPWSINVDLYGPDNEDLGGFYDSGYSIVATLTETEVAEISPTLADIGALVLLKEVHARRKQERKALGLLRRRTRDGS